MSAYERFRPEFIEWCKDELEVYRKQRRDPPVTSEHDPDGRKDHAKLDVIIEGLERLIEKEEKQGMP